jgi:hypothetical protein
MAEPRQGSVPSLLVLARDLSDSVRVGGQRTVAAALAIDPETALILGSGVAAAPAAALRDVLASVSAGPALKGVHRPRILCPPELVADVRDRLPAVWRSAEITVVEPGAAAEDLFDSLVGHLAGRGQPSDLPAPADWAMLFRQAQAYVEAAPWRRLSDDVHLRMDLRVGGAPTQRVGIVLGNAGITYGFALYPGDAEPPGGQTRNGTTAPPPGTLMMTLDPAAALPGYLVAKARRYEWPDGPALMPVFFVWTEDGAADLNSEQVVLLMIALAAALTGDAERQPTQRAGDMILSGGRPGQYHVEVKPETHRSAVSVHDIPTIDVVLQEFLTGCRSRLSARTVRTYEAVIDLVRACLNSYGYQSLSEAEQHEFQLAYEAGDEQAFCRMFGAEKIAESVGEFLGYFMPRKVVAGEELLRASGTVVGKLVAWLAEWGAIPPEVAQEAQQRARAAARDLPQAARLAAVLFDAAESGRSVRVEALDDADYIEDELMISRVEPGRLWFDDDIGPVKVPRAASDLARPGWTVSLVLGRVRGQWRMVQVGSVYP